MYILRLCFPGRDSPHPEDVMRGAFLAPALTLSAPASAGGQQPVGDSAYTTSDVMIPMRDGVRLHTVIVAPRGAGALPLLMDRTPYGAAGAAGGVTRNAAYLGLSGYIIVLQDIRRRLGPQGTFPMHPPPHPRHAGTPPSTPPPHPIPPLLTP